MKTWENFEIVDESTISDLRYVGKWTAWVDSILEALQNNRSLGNGKALRVEFDDMDTLRKAEQSLRNHALKILGPGHLVANTREENGKAVLYIRRGPDFG